MSLSGSFRINASVTNTLETLDLSVPTEEVTQNVSKSISGTGVVYHDTATIPSGGSLTIDVGNSSLSDAFGNTIAMTTVTGFYIAAASTNTVDVTITTDTNTFLGTMPALSAGESIGFLCNIDTTIDSKIKIVAGAANSDVNIIITGTEA